MDRHSMSTPYTEEIQKEAVIKYLHEEDFRLEAIANQIEAEGRDSSCARSCIVRVKREIVRLLQK